MKTEAQEARCMGCGIMVGNGYEEKKLYRVGDYYICGWCRQQLARHGRLWVEPYHERRYLYADGRVKGRRKIASERLSASRSETCLGLSGPIS